MKNISILLLPIGIFAVLSVLGCGKKQASPNPALSEIDLKRGELILCSGQEFGEVSFSQSCNPAVRKQFDLALSLLHSFEYDEAEKAFAKVIDADPDCAMAYWGAAMSLYHPLWSPAGERDLEKGAKLLEIAASLPKTDRERDFIQAIEVYFKDWENTPAKARAWKVTQKMQEIYEKNEQDTEAAILYALALNATADPTDKSYTNQRKAGAILEAIYPAYPNHPGIAHYIIHSYDNPVLAEKALAIARKYADIAPGSSHAQHMPSHIFTRLGLWDESIQSNSDAAASAVCYAQSAGINGHWEEEMHSLDYLVYALLQKGDNQKAAQQKEYLDTIQKITPINFKVAYALAAIPARIALENKDWPTAATLAPPPIALRWQEFPWQEAILHFTRALGASHLGKIADAEKEMATLEALHQKLVAREMDYEANQVMVQLKASQAWLHFAKGNKEAAVASMQEAADLEDRTSKHPVTPGEVLPARELLGDLLLALGHPAAALTAYESTLKNTPGRFNSIYGAAIASQKLGRMEQAKGYFEKLLAASESVAVSRPEIAIAKGAVDE